jgi:hypothetical protein
MSMPGFTAVNSLGKSVTNYNQFGWIKPHRLASFIKPQLRINDPLVIDLLGRGGGIDFDVPMPVDFPSGEGRQTCAQCRSKCYRLPRSLRADCLDSCPCPDG